MLAFTLLCVAITYTLFPTQIEASVDVVQTKADMTVEALTPALESSRVRTIHALGGQVPSDVSIPSRIARGAVSSFGEGMYGFSVWLTRYFLAPALLLLAIGMFRDRANLLQGLRSLLSPSVNVS